MSEAVDCWECNSALDWSDDLPDEESDLLCHHCAYDRLDKTVADLRAECTRLEGERKLACDRAEKAEKALAKAHEDVFAAVQEHLRRALVAEKRLLETLAECDELRRSHIQLMRVSGALCDAGDVPVEPYDQAVRLLTKQRDEARGFIHETWPYWGTCVDCPRDPKPGNELGNQRPWECIYSSRYDHRIPAHGRDDRGKDDR